MGLVRTGAPAVTPVSLSEARAFLRIPDDITGDNDQLSSWLASGTQRCEETAGLSLITQTWELTLDSFFDDRNGAYCDPWLGSVIQLPRPPLQSVSSIVYTATDGTLTTLASTEYQVDASSRLPGRVRPAYGKVWPTPRAQLAAVKITFVAGYGAAGTSVPDEVKDAIKSYVAYRNERREEPDEDFLDRLFRRFWSGSY